MKPSANRKGLPWLSLCAVLLLSALPRLSAQAIYAATETTRIQAGAGWLLLNPAYGGRINQGISAWVDYDFHRLLGLEAEAHFGGLESPGDIGENSYLVGPRFTHRKRRFTLYGKAMLGHASITNQLYDQSSSFNLYALGGGMEYKVSRRLNVRAVDFEMQKWPDFKPGNLSPTVITVGLSYVIR